MDKMIDRFPSTVLFGKEECKQDWMQFWII
jgi:hypothetical protein